MSSLTAREEEIALVQKAQTDLNSFGHIYERYFEKIYKFFHFRLRDEENSQDLTSETFEKALTKLHTFKDHGYPFSTWLFRIAHNVLVDFFRTRKHRQNTSFDELLPSEEPFITLDYALIDNQEAVAKVKEIIATFPRLHQDIWGLKLSSDMSNKEIAETLNINANNVNVIIFRGIQVIKEKLKRYRF